MNLHNHTWFAVTTDGFLLRDGRSFATTYDFCNAEIACVIRNRTYHPFASPDKIVYYIVSLDAHDKALDRVS